MKKLIVLLILGLSSNIANAQFCPPQASPIPGLNYACWDHLYFLEQDTICFDEGSTNVNNSFLLYYGYPDNMVPNWLANVSSTWIYKVNGQLYNPVVHSNYQWTFPFNLNINIVPDNETTNGYIELEIALFGIFPPSFGATIMGGGVMFKTIYICVNNVNEPPYVIFADSVWSP